MLSIRIPKIVLSTAVIAAIRFCTKGAPSKPIHDSQLQRVLVHRYRCCQCQRSFRHYPHGVERADQSVRLQQLAAIGWMLGLSTRGVSGFLSAFRVVLAHMSVWRDVQKLAEPLSQRWRGRKVCVLGVDGVYGHLKGQTHAMTIAVDLGSGRPVAVAQIDEHDTDQIVEWLKPLREELGIEVIVTDDLNEYAHVAEQLSLQHQVGHFYLQRWVGKTLKELEEPISEEWREVLAQVRGLVKALPATGHTTLFELYEWLPAERKARGERASPLYRLRQLVLQLSEHWDKYCLYQKQADVPKTDNRTEQAIGRWHTRSRSVRGFKSWTGLRSAFSLCATRAF